ncbi:MAG: hypothetical protein CMM25_02175 [Rhodospirillaceae bacterium]|nr:hypothetical protein [Rhodospirillaceae bacterium]
MFFGKVFISAVVLAVVLWKVDILETVAALSSLNITHLITATIFYIIAHCLNGLKLHLLMPDRPLFDLIKYTFIALLYGTILPGQILGDAIKAYKLVRPNDDGAKVIAAVVLDKIIGLISLIFITLIALLLDTKNFPDIFGLLAFCALVFFLMIVLLPFFLKSMPPLLDTSLGRFLRAWREYSDNYIGLFVAFLTGIAFQIISVSVIAVLGAALGVSISFISWVAVVGLMSFALLVPLSFAGLGIRESGLIVFLGFLGVANTDALALSFLVFSYTLLGASIGWFFDIKERPT